jgi:hypothetical protein
VLRLLVTANVVPGSLILLLLMIEAVSSSGTSVVTWSTQHHIREDGLSQDNYISWPINGLTSVKFEPVFLLTVFRFLYVTIYGLQDLGFSRRWLLRMSSGMLRRVALVRTDVSEECIASIIRVIKIGELETTLEVTNNRSTLQKYYDIIVISPWWWKLYLPSKRRFLQERQDATSQ